MSIIMLYISGYIWPLSIVASPTKDSFVRTYYESVRNIQSILESPFRWVNIDLLLGRLDSTQAISQIPKT